MSTLHRLCDRFGQDYAVARELENELIRDFRRRYSEDDVERVEKDLIYCLGKMQHYGAPTRLIDWTYSFFISLFFAIEKASANKPFYIWVFRHRWTLDEIDEKGLDAWKIRDDDVLRGKGDLFEDELFIKQHRFVFPESAFVMNTRISDQQGVFLCPGIVEETIDQIIDAELDKSDFLKLIRIELDASEFAKVIDKLFRMTMSYRTIYADTESLGRDLSMRVPTFMMRVRRRAERNSQ